MTYRLEHANITVRDLDKALRLLQAVFPDWRVRGTSQTKDPGAALTWMHAGTDDTYVCLCPATVEPAHPRQFYREPGVNHIGFAVDDTEAIRQRVEAAGYSTKYAEPHPYRKRLYVIDDDGMEWEFVEYCSEDPAERNDYHL